MKPCLTRTKAPQLVGMHDGIRGDVSGLRGDVSGLSGDVSGLSGDVSGLSGDVSGLSGDVDACELTYADRMAGVDVHDLVTEEPTQ